MYFSEEDIRTDRSALILGLDSAQNKRIELSRLEANLLFKS